MAGFIPAFFCDDIGLTPALMQGRRFIPARLRQALNLTPLSLKCSVAACENIFWAIEVKKTANLRSKAVNSLVAFKEDYPESEVHRNHFPL